jgi:hypothetical protein
VIWQIAKNPAAFRKPAGFANGFAKSPNFRKTFLAILRNDVQVRR